MDVEQVYGDLLEQPVEVIINSWNRNLIPWWLLLPQGVSGAIKRRGGCQPFKEVAKVGVIPLGGAALTGAGRLPFKAIIHVAGINLVWRSTERSIQDSVFSAMNIVNEQGFKSVAFPIIGSGSGGVWGRSQKHALALMRESFKTIESDAHVRIVIYGK